MSSSGERVSTTLTCTLTVWLMVSDCRSFSSISIAVSGSTCMVRRSRVSQMFSGSARRWLFFWGKSESRAHQCNWRIPLPDNWSVRQKHVVCRTAGFACGGMGQTRQIWNICEGTYSTRSHHLPPNSWTSQPLLFSPIQVVSFHHLYPFHRPLTPCIHSHYPPPNPRSHLRHPFHPPPTPFVHSLHPFHPPLNQCTLW